jgi:hypothetical protein
MVNLALAASILLPRARCMEALIGMRRKMQLFQMDVARPERFERPTPRFVVWCSIQLSYGRVFCLRILGRKDPAMPRAFGNTLSAGREGAPLLPAPARLGKLCKNPSRRAGRCLARPAGRFRSRRQNGHVILSVTSTTGERGSPQDRPRYARARSLRTLRSSIGRSGMVIRKVAPIVPSTR